MADSVLLLQVLLSGPSVNLRSVAEVFRGDVGLTVELLRLAASDDDDRLTVGIGITDNVIHAGLDSLRALASRVEPLTSHPCGRAALRQCEQFWGHARLTGLLAEELAYKHANIDAEEAYAAGLLFHVAELPSLLGWQCSVTDAPACERAGRLTRQWRLPEVLDRVVCAEDPRSSSTSHPLLRIARLADEQARNIQGLVAKYARGVF
jgi:HD-like signal output (HDOD) protein